ERRAGNGEDIAALLEREARRDERARAHRRLDDDDAERETGDDAIAAREELAARLRAERHFRDEQAALGDLRMELAILLRIDDIETAADDAYGSAIERGAVGGRVDAAGKPRDDDIAFLAEIAGDGRGDPGPRRGCVARTHNGDGLLRGEMERAANR